MQEQLAGWQEEGAGDGVRLGRHGHIRGVHQLRGDDDRQERLGYAGDYRHHNHSRRHLPHIRRLVRHHIHRASGKPINSLKFKLTTLKKFGYDNDNDNSRKNIQNFE